MRIGYDVRPFLKHETGVGVYFKKLLFELTGLDEKNEYFLFTSSLKDRFPPEKIPPLPKMCFRDFHIPVKVMNFLWYRLGWPPLDSFFRTRLDLSHSPTPLPLPSHGKKIVTVYDLFFLDVPEMADKQARRDFRRKLGGAFHRADGIVTISNFTRDHLLDRFPIDPGKVKVIHLGVDKEFWMGESPDGQDDISSRFDLPPSFLLFVGALERRKNLLNLLDAFDILRKEDQSLFLVLAGREGEDSPNIQKKIQTLGLQDRVRIIGYCSESNLRDLYRLADLLVFPSFQEGFGLPVVEAMACRLPVAASRTSALTEIGQDAVAYFDPGDPGDIARTIHRVLKDSAYRSGLIDLGMKRAGDFSWAKTAAETLEFYREVVEK